MASMSAAFESLCVVVLTACAVCSCASEPQVTIAVTRNEALTVAPSFLRFSFPVKDSDTIEAGVFNVEAIPDEAFAAVPPRVSFSVDVAGCLELDPKACEDEAGFVGRGCAGPFSRERDTELAITVELLPTAEGNAACPVAP